MKLGIDLGTTHTVVAAADRGNYPVIGFANGEGEWSEFLLSRHEGVRSFKRELGRSSIGDGAFETTAAFVRSLERELRTRSNLQLGDGEPLEAMVGVPANATSTQRFLTLEAFRRAGFHVLGMVNEPSAAGLEYAHRFRRSLTSVREHVLVYDLGGGTFDASLIDMGERDHRVLASAGIQELGGDDFDRALFDLVIERAGLDALPPAAERALLAECCLKKESIVPQTKRLVIDLPAFCIGREPLLLAVQDVLERCEPLVQRTVPVLLSALSTPQGEVPLEAVAGVYVVGGASGLPSVGRVLKEHFGRRVHRSPYPFASTAIGLAIAADTASGLELADCFTRYFGVWREAQAGREAVFDPVFARDTPLPRTGGEPLVRVRHYRAGHDIGHYRFLECSRLSDGTPAGDLVLGREVLFPFDPGLRATKLEGRPVRCLDFGPMVEERFECGADGIVRFTLSTDDGYSRTFDLCGD